MEYVNKAITIENSESIYFQTRGEIYKAKGLYENAICDFTKSLSLKDDIKEAYKYRGECYRELAKVTSSNEKEIEYNALAEADEKKYEELNKLAHK